LAQRKLRSQRLSDICLRTLEKRGTYRGIYLKCHLLRAKGGNAGDRKGNTYARVEKTKEKVREIMGKGTGTVPKYRCGVNYKENVKMQKKKRIWTSSAGDEMPKEIRRGKTGARAARWKKR